jgi:hypothetical protein
MGAQVLNGGVSGVALAGSVIGGLSVVRLAVAAGGRITRVGVGTTGALQADRRVKLRKIRTRLGSGINVIIQKKEFILQ